MKEKVCLGTVSCRQRGGRVPGNCLRYNRFRKPDEATLRSFVVWCTGSYNGIPNRCYCMGITQETSRYIIRLEQKPYGNALEYICAQCHCFSFMYLYPMFMQRLAAILAYSPHTLKYFWLIKDFLRNDFFPLGSI